MVELKPFCCFTIQTILSNENEYALPFNLYKNDDWDIEHVRSQTDKALWHRQRMGKRYARIFYSFVDESEQKQYIDTIENTDEVFRTI